MKLLTTIALGAALIAAAASARADITVGVTLSATGPAASLGIPEKNTIALMPTTIGGQKVNYIVLDDKSDTTAAVANTRKLITEDKADVIIGSTVSPNSLAMIDVVSEAKVPMISMAASASIVEPVKCGLKEDGAPIDCQLNRALEILADSAGYRRALADASAAHSE